MAVNVPVINKDFPNNSKTVSVDLTEFVPFGNGGEDTWLLSAVTSATASGGAAIQRLYLSDAKFGWAKSSGLKTGPYDVTGSQKHLKVAIDEDISGGAQIALDSSALPLGGDAVAKDLQTKINQLGTSGGSKAGNLSYLNATVNYVNGVFEIVSGTAGAFYTGSDRTSVAVADGTTTTGLASELGFDIPFTSEQLASSQVKQTSLSVAYTSGTTLNLSNSGLIATGDCIAITNGTTTEFRGVQTAFTSTITLASGLVNTYDAGSLVQVLGLRDPSAEPPAIYSSIDDYVRFAIQSIVNQINFAG